MSEGIQLRSISRSYGSGPSRIEVLRELSLTVPPGELLALMGPSGVGKSTLLHIIGGLDRPDGGEVLYDGRSVLSLAEQELDRFRNLHVGFVFQFHYLLPEFTAIENVAMPCLIRGLERKAARRRAEGLLEAVGLGDRMGHKPGELSGGEQQRVAVARALANEPRVLLADEPTGNLDGATGAMIFDLFLALHEERGLTTVVATHNERLADKCHRVLRVSGGKVVDG